MRVDYEKKSDGVRDHHEKKKRWGESSLKGKERRDESSPSERAMG